MTWSSNQVLNKKDLQVLGQLLTRMVLVTKLQNNPQLPSGIMKTTSNTPIQTTTMIDTLENTVMLPANAYQDT